VSRVSKPADGTTTGVLPTWKSAIQQVWKPALHRPAVVALKNLRGKERSCEIALQRRNQNDGIRPDACQRMKSANGFFLMEYFTSVGTFHPLGKGRATPAQKCVFVRDEF
jgi:hypothetical protein